MLILNTISPQLPVSLRRQWLLLFPVSDQQLLWIALKRIPSGTWIWIKDGTMRDMAYEKRAGQSKGLVARERGLVCLGHGRGSRDSDREAGMPSLRRNTTEVVARSQM